MIYLVFIARILLTLVFTVSAVSKSRSSLTFARTIQQLGIPSKLAHGTGWFLILYEAMLGGLFAFQIIPLFALLATFLLLAIFIGTSLRAMLLKQKILCNCFGVADAYLGKQTLLRALFLILTTSIYFISILSSPTNWQPSTLNATISLLSLVVAAILLVQWLLASESLLALIKERRRNEKEIARHYAQELLSDI